MDTGTMEVAVASGRSFADVPGTHVVRRDEGNAPNIYNTDSHDVIEDLPAHPAWPRVIEITGAKDTSELRQRVRRPVFLVETRRPDHHSPQVPADIATAEPKVEEPGDACGRSG